MLLSKLEGSVIHAHQAYQRLVGSLESEGCEVSKMIEEEYVESTHKSKPSVAGVGPPTSAIVSSPYRDTEMLQSIKETMEHWIRERGGFFIIESADSLRLITLSAYMAARDIMNVEAHASSRILDDLSLAYIVHYYGKMPKDPYLGMERQDQNNQTSWLTSFSITPALFSEIASQTFTIKALQASPPSLSLISSISSISPRRLTPSSSHSSKSSKS